MKIIVETLTIRKLDAACRQFNTAIALWFTGGDLISIHTLARSAYQIGHDINRKKGGRDLLYDSLLIKDEYRTEAISILKKSYNFFKHANKDPDPFGTIDFKLRSTEVFMIFTSFGLELLGCKPDEYRGAFNVYWFLRNPHLLTEKGREQWINRIPADTRDLLLSIQRTEFFDAYITMTRNNKTMWQTLNDA